MNAIDPSLRFVEINGTRTAVSATGTGRPLLLLHGAEGSRKSFAALARLLAPAFRVIAYDQRDCGETANPASGAGLRTLADDAAALLRALGHSKAIVFGTSFGGRVAQALALAHPDCIERLILASTWSIDRALQALNPDVVGATRRLRDELPGSAEQLARYFFPEAFLESHPQFKRHFSSAPRRSERSERRAAAVADVPPLDPSRIAARTLVAAGELDVLVPAALTLQLGQAIRASDSIVLEGVGHLGHVQAPEAVAAYIRAFSLASP